MSGVPSLSSLARGSIIEAIRFARYRRSPIPVFRCRRQRASRLFTLYLATDIDPALVPRLEAAGGQRVPAANPYWDEWGVTVADPDGYRLVLCRRSWSNT